MAELFHEDPAYALEFLNSILEDGDQVELLIAFRQMTKEGPFRPLWFFSYGLEV